MIAVALVELNMLPTKQLIFNALQDNSEESKESLAPFSDHDLAVLYEQSFDFDGNLLSLALASGDKLNYLTEALVLLFMVQDVQLKFVAIAHYLRDNDLMDMLLEDKQLYTLSFEINKDISLRTFLQDALFRELVLTAVQIIGETDRAQCACLLNKIYEDRRVL